MLVMCAGQFALNGLKKEPGQIVEVPYQLAIVSRMALTVGSFAVFFKPRFLIFNWLNDLFSEREDSAGNGTGRSNYAKEKALSEMLHSIDPYHF